MEGFFETFVYLLITIVILVLSLRKKKQQSPAPAEEEKQESPFKDLFADEEEPDEDYEPVPQPASATSGAEAKQEERPVQWMSDDEAKALVMDADAVMKEAAENNPIADYEGEPEHVQDDAYSVGDRRREGIAFDLRKAVIYSEILGRRTF